MNVQVPVDIVIITTLNMRFELLPCLFGVIAMVLLVLSFVVRMGRSRES